MISIEGDRMIEIDGEFFEDPCERIRYERYQAVIALANTGSEMIRVQTGIILSQPLFPPKFAEGGIINPNICKGDIIHPALWDMETEEEKNKNYNETP